MIKRLQILLEQQANVELAFLYGSHAVQKANAESDLDIATSGVLTVDERLTLAEALSHEFHCEVDLVDLSTAHGALLQEILTRGICVIKRNLPLYDKLIKRMLMEKEDDSRFAAKTTKERIHRWLDYDKISVFEKLDSMVRCLERVREKTPTSLAELTADLDRQDIIMFNLERAIQASVDIASHIIAYTSLPAPITMADSFEKLAHAKIITKETAEKMKKAVGLRNILVHEYQKIDWSIIWAVITTHMMDFHSFVAEIQSAKM